MKNKGQSEIVGFVLIVVIVAILAVFFLAFTLRQPSDKPESKEIVNFLISMQTYTSSCAISYEPQYLELSSLIKRCYNNAGEICLSGEEVCQVLNLTLSSMLTDSWRDKSWQFSLYYNQEEQKDKFFSLEQGNITANYAGAEQPIENDYGNIVMKMNVYS